ncbi:MAG TPA: hypothetical protein GXZ96_00360 [Firmicutes bacterium]|jgi:epoxyqueuosine reductase|nr:hypothetical protein [Bacillota bacterium]
MSLTEEIKSYALDLGFCRVGCTPADNLADYADILQARKAHYDFWIREPHGLLQGAQPNTLMPSAKSVLVLVWDYLPKP